MRFSRAGAVWAVSGIYLVLRLVAAFVRPGHLPPPLAILLGFSFAAVLVLVQLGVVVKIAGLGLSARKMALVFFCGLVVYIGVLALMLLKIKPIAPILGVAADVSLMVTAASLGTLVSLIIREPNIILPVAVCAGIVDLWNVFVGPLGRVVANHPEIVDKVTVHVQSPVAGFPMLMIGMGDVLFLALFFSVLYRFSMNTKGAFWLGYALLTLSLFATMLPFVNALPALVPMGIAILVANIRHFKLSKEELVSTLIVSGGLILLLFLLFLHKK